MIAAVVVGSVFALVVTVTWLSSRADASQARCDHLAQHIRTQLEIPTANPARRRPAGPRARR